MDNRPYLGNENWEGEGNVKTSALWGSLITGFDGWVFAVNSMLGGEEIGAGFCLFASAIAFGVIALLAIKQ